MTWLIDRLDLFYTLSILKDHNWAISKTDGQTTTNNWTRRNNPRRSKKITPVILIWGTVRASRSKRRVPCSVQDSKKKKLRNPGPLDRSDQAPKPRTGPVLCEYYWRATFHVTLRGYIPLLKSDTIDLAGHKDVCRLSVWLVKSRRTRTAAKRSMVEQSPRISPSS